MTGYRGFGWLLLLPLSLCAAASCDSNTLIPVRDAGQDLPTEGGTIQITADTNNCPTVAVTLAPPDANVGDSVVVGARAFDPDVGPDGGASQALTFVWSAKAGSFEDAKAAQTRYRCETGGPQVLTVAVSDGKCTAAISATVDCFALPGTVGSGGSSGTGGSSGSGTGGKSGSGGGTSSGGPGSGGSGMGGPSGSGGASAGQCSGDPTMDEGNLCNQCTTDNCGAETDGCQRDKFDSEARWLACLNLYCCFRSCKDKGPLGDDPQKCWCGSASEADCYSVDSAANGPCLKEVQAAAESKSAADIRLRRINPNYPLGRAWNLTSCRGQFCSKFDSNGEPQNPVPCRQ